MVIHSCPRYGISMSIDEKSCGPYTKLCQKPYKFDLEVKGQHCLGIMNKRNIFYPCAKNGMLISLWVGYEDTSVI